MTLPDNRPARKPRRLGLIIPWGLAVVFVVAWSLGWVWLKGETERRMDAARASMAQTGWRLDWSSRTVSGFPFRLNVDLQNARWGEASGWSITAPALKAQAYISAPTHWVMLAPMGGVITRPNGDLEFVTAKVLRGSLSDFGAVPPRISVEGIGLRVGTNAGAQPVWMSTAAEFHLHAKAGPNDQGALYIELDQARTSAGMEPPETSIFDATYTHARALRGRNFSDAFQSWAKAGGTLHIRRLDDPPHSPFAWGIVDPRPLPRHTAPP